MKQNEMDRRADKCASILILDRGAPYFKITFCMGHPISAFNLVRESDDDALSLESHSPTDNNYFQWYYHSNLSCFLNLVLLSYAKDLSYLRCESDNSPSRILVWVEPPSLSPNISGKIMYPEEVVHPFK